jgi:hypothetical protein
MLNPLKAASLGVIATLCITGCKKTADNTINYTSAINTYLSGHQSCLWPESIKFPVQIGTNDSKTQPYDALVDQGLLTRTSSEKKIIIISKQENNYDLSDKGRGQWTADTAQPGYGNFCYGHRSVQSIVSSTPNTGQPGAITQVTYTYNSSSAPDWAKAPETQTAFPKVASDLNPGNATATLVDTSDGWQVQPSTRNPDATIVQ